MPRPQLHWFWRGAIAFICCPIAMLLPPAVVYVPMVYLVAWLVPSFLAGPARVLAIPIYLCLPSALVATIIYGILTRCYGPMRGDNETRCRKCGYILKGIPEARCSECGERI